jgi:hypothetical protein
MRLLPPERAAELLASDNISGIAVPFFSKEKEKR